MIPVKWSSVPDWMRIVATEVNPLISSPSASPNFAPNSQWEVMSALGWDTAYNELCTGTETPLSYDSATNGGSLITITRAAGFDSAWSVGRLVYCDTGDAALRQKPMRILAKTATTIQVRLPYNTATTSGIAGTIRLVNVGGPVSTGTGDAADGWSKDTTLLVWRDGFASNLAIGARYALSCRKGAAGTERLYTPLVGFAGRTVAFGATVRQRVKSGTGTWRVYITSDGTNGKTVSSANADSTAFQPKEVSYTIPSDATAVSAGIEFIGASSDAYCVCNPMLVVGSRVGPYTYPQSFLLPKVKIEPWINVTTTFGTSFVVGRGYQYPVDLYADSGAQIAPTVKMMMGNWEGINTNAVVTGTTGNRTFGMWQADTDPTLIGFVTSQQVSNVKSYAKANIFIDASGWCQAVSFCSADSWSNISIDLDAFLLG